MAPVASPYSKPGLAVLLGIPGWDQHGQSGVAEEGTPGGGSTETRPAICTGDTNTGAGSQWQWYFYTGNIPWHAPPSESFSAETGRVEGSLEGAQLTVTKSEGRSSKAPSIGAPPEDSAHSMDPLLSPHDSHTNSQLCSPTFQCWLHLLLELHCSIKYYTDETQLWKEIGFLFYKQQGQWKTP